MRLWGGAVASTSPRPTSSRSTGRSAPGLLPVASAISWMDLMDLAGLLHRYYTVHHILSVDDRALLQARLLLFSAVAEAIGRGLDLLGVTAPDRM